MTATLVPRPVPDAEPAERSQRRDAVSSGLYVGTVRHRRHTDRPHAFRFRLFLAYLDLDELADLLDRHPLWSSRRAAPLRFRARDYFDGTHDDPTALADAVRDLVGERLGTRPDGPVRLLTHVRTMGWLFNPLSTYYCFDADAELVAVVAEVTNTPWHQRHWYVVPANASGVSIHLIPKELPVSPFQGMDQSYRFSFRPPGERLWLRFENLRSTDGAPVFDADLVLRRVPITVGSMITVPLRHPALTFRVSAGIHTQAMRLAVKRAPFHPHPDESQRRRLPGQRRRDVTRHPQGSPSPA